MSTQETFTDDSEAYVRQLLDAKFKLKQAGLTTSQLVTYLADFLKTKVSSSMYVVSLTGGAGSGKSTLAEAVNSQLTQAGIASDVIRTEDYILGDRQWRWHHFESSPTWDPTGKYDFKLMNDTITRIRNNRDNNTTIKVPTYDSVIGLAIDAGPANYTHAIGKLDLLIVEGDMPMAENPDLTIYLHTPDQHRLQMRLVRDAKHRSVADPQKIIDNFTKRHHNQHLSYTLPAIKKANIVLTAQPEDSEWRYDMYLRH